MKDDYDFSNAKRGAVISTHKTRISIRLDPEVLEWFKKQVEKRGDGNYQSLIKQALLEHVKHEEGEPLEKILRRVVREELQQSSTRNMGAH